MTCALLCLGNWSVLALIHDKDKEEVGRMPEVDDNDPNLREEGEILWDVLDSDHDIY